MAIFPSLLEYSQVAVRTKLENLASKKLAYQNLTHTPNGFDFALHLDFVLDQFAKDRHAMCSVGFITIMDELEMFRDYRLHLSIHFMGTTEDIFEIDKLLKSFSFNQKWNFVLYFPQNFVANFQYLEQLFSNVSIGIWLDLGEWDSKKIDKLQTQNILLMTVKAGKSGQKRSDSDKTLAINLVERFPNKDFLLDGGWSVDENNAIPNNANLVSYSNFWSLFDESI